MVYSNSLFLALVICFCFSLAQVSASAELVNVILDNHDTEMKLTYHNYNENRGQVIPYCEDDNSIVDKRVCNNLETMGDGEDEAEKRNKVCARQNTGRGCCICGGGKNSHINSTVTFHGEEHSQASTSCFLPGRKKAMPLKFKHTRYWNSLKSEGKITDDTNVNMLVNYLCTLNIKPLLDKLNLFGDHEYTNESQLENDNAIIVERNVIKKLKPGTTAIQLVFSSQNGSIVYYFPWLDDYLSLLQEYVLGPLEIPIENVNRICFANMPANSTINEHFDTGKWAADSHRVHIPMITHEDVYFLTSHGRSRKSSNDVVRIKAGPGEAFEFNNVALHAVRNLGDSNRVHLIIDWVEKPVEKHMTVRLKPRQQCHRRPNKNGILECMSEGSSDEL